MPRPPVGAPPLPAHAPGDPPWICVVQRHGWAPTPLRANFYYFIPKPPGLNPFFHAVDAARQVWLIMGLATAFRYPTNYKVGPSQCWGWDGVTLHTGEYSPSISGGVINDWTWDERVVVINKIATFAGGIVRGRWHSGPIQAVGIDSKGRLGTVEHNAWKNIASAFTGDFPLGPAAWNMAVFCPRTTGLLHRVTEAYVMRDLREFRKRRRDPAHYATATPIPNFPDPFVG
jgi:hypothetical protein